jgi:SAM-dependent methyltransferase
VKDIEAQRLQCPDCRGRIDASLRCLHCARQFTYQQGVYDLLPLQIEEVKRNEDLEFAAYGDNPAGQCGRHWRLVVGRLELLRFDYEILPLYRGGRFLELGGGPCSASAIYKSVFPDAPVYASDVSPHALRNAAIPSCRMFPQQPDHFVALDAETIPFQADTFNSVFAMSMIHHLPNPLSMLNEVERVLAPGGTFVAIDASVPPHFRWLFSREAEDRVSRYGIQEALIPYAQWVSMIADSNLPLHSLRTYRNPQYLRQPLRALAGNLIQRLPERIAQRFFPTGILIVYDKP